MSVTLNSTRAWSWRVAVLLASLTSANAIAQTFFYTEVVKDGRIYVFARSAAYDAFVKNDGAVIGSMIQRPGYGAKGETVVFDSEDAINLYNYKHGLPGEQFVNAEKKPEPKFPSSKISGLMFGDYYWFAQSHSDQVSSADPTPVRDLHGFWFRRLYFTYDFAYSERLSTRFRLEANSNGDFEGGDIVPYVKDAYVKWTYTRKQQLTLGIQPTLTFDWLDGFWGLRHIEKTPADLYRLDSSRDFGFTFSGPSRIDGLSYGAQFGNESGSGSETEEGKIVRFESRYERTPGIVLEGFYSFSTRPEGERHHTAQAVVGVRNTVARIGGQYLWQDRRPGRDDAPNQGISVWSGFGVWERQNRADLFFRVDAVKGDLGGVETGLPGAEDIDYWVLSSQSPFTIWIVGGEWYLHPSVRLSPNLELVRYARDPDPVTFPGRREDAILRFTFFWTF
jgi:hypothetical protein